METAISESIAISTSMPISRSPSKEPSKGNLGFPRAIPVRLLRSPLDQFGPALYDALSTGKAQSRLFGSPSPATPYHS